MSFHKAQHDLSAIFLYIILVEFTSILDYPLQVLSREFPIAYQFFIIKIQWLKPFRAQHLSNFSLPRTIPCGTECTKLLCIGWNLSNNFVEVLEKIFLYNIIVWHVIEIYFPVIVAFLEYVKQAIMVKVRAFHKI